MGYSPAARAGRAKSGASFALNILLRPRRFRRAPATGVICQRFDMSNDNKITGNRNTVGGTGNSVSGDENTVLGQTHSVSGRGNTVIGGANNSIGGGTGNTILGGANNSIGGSPPHAGHEEKLFEGNVVDSPPSGIGAHVKSNAGKTTVRGNVFLNGGIVVGDDSPAAGPTPDAWYKRPLGLIFVGVVIVVLGAAVIWLINGLAGTDI